jgi:hypothetical protein
MILLALVTGAARLDAQPAGGAPRDGAEAFAETLRRTDPEAHARFVRLRDARERSAEELQRLEGRYRGVAPEGRLVLLPSLRAARRQYADDSLALLEFLDERDRRTIEELRRGIEQVTAMLQQRQKAREELEALRRD